MGRSKTTLADYLLLAQEKNLKYLEDDAHPGGIEERVPWLCEITGQHFIRSFAQIRANDFPSPGQRVRHDFLEKYHDVAADIGIEFIYEGDDDPCFFPQNTKTPCRWRGIDGNIVYTTYYELAYDRMTQDTKSWLGLDVHLRQPATEVSEISDYRNSGLVKGLDLLDSREIISDDQAVMWRCKRTKAIFAASLNEVKSSATPSPGEQYHDANIGKYKFLSKSLGIDFIYYGGQDIFPQSDVHPSRWRGIDGDIVWASYSELSGSIRSSLKARLGVQLETV